MNIVEQNWDLILNKMKLEYFILSLFPSLRQEIFRNAVFRTSADRTVAYTYTYAILLHGTVRLFIEEDILPVSDSFS